MPEKDSQWKPDDWRKGGDPLKHKDWRDGGDWRHGGNWNHKKYERESHGNSNKGNKGAK